ncbi:MAG: hypothetical protein AAF627_00565 [Myxococcota bacterium]
MSPSPPRLGQLLVDLGFIDEVQLDAALRQQRERGGRLGKILVDNSVITEERLTHALSRQLGIDSCDPVEAPVHPKVLALIPVETALELRVMPVARKREGDMDVVYVALADPLDQRAMEAVRQALGSGARVHWMLAGETEMELALEKKYGRSAPQRASQAPQGPSYYQGVPVVQGLPFKKDLPQRPAASAPSSQPSRPPSRSPSALFGKPGAFDLQTDFEGPQFDQGQWSEEEAPADGLSYDAFATLQSADMQPVEDEFEGIDSVDVDEGPADGNSVSLDLTPKREEVEAIELAESRDIQPLDEEEVLEELEPIEDGETDAESLSEPVDADDGVDADAQAAPTEEGIDAEALAAPIEDEAEVDAGALAAPFEVDAGVEAEALAAPLEGDAEIDAEALAAPLEGDAEVDVDALAVPLEDDAEVDAEALDAPLEDDAEVDAEALAAPFEDDVGVDAEVLAAPSEDDAEALAAPREDDAEVDAEALDAPIEDADASPPPEAERVEAVAFATGPEAVQHEVLDRLSEEVQGSASEEEGQLEFASESENEPSFHKPEVHVSQDLPEFSPEALSDFSERVPEPPAVVATRAPSPASVVSSPAASRTPAPRERSTPDPSLKWGDLLDGLGADAASEAVRDRGASSAVESDSAAPTQDVEERPKPPPPEVVASDEAETGDLRDAESVDALVPQTDEIPALDASSQTTEDVQDPNVFDEDTRFETPEPEWAHWLRETEGTHLRTRFAAALKMLSENGLFDADRLEAEADSLQAKNDVRLE